MARICSSRRGLALAVLVVSLTLLAGACARRPSPQPAAVAPAPPPADEPPGHSLDTAPSLPAITYRYPPYRYHVEGPDARLVGVDVYSTDIIFRADYWIVGGSPVVIEIRFDEPAPDPAAVVRHIRQCIPGALVHEEGHEADRVFVKATLPPGRYHIFLPAIEWTPDDWRDHRVLILDRGWPFRLMRWEPGGSPASLGEHLLPTHFSGFGPYAAALEAGEGEAFFAAGDIGWENAVGLCLWRWQSGAQPPLTLLGGLWCVQSMYRAWVFPRDDDLLVQTLLSLFVLDRSGEIIATLVEGRLAGTAVGPGGEVAVFVGREDKGAGEVELDLTVFTAALETYRTWDAICPHGKLDIIVMPDVQPIWHGDEIFFLALEDRHQVPPTYQLMGVDVSTGSVRRLLGSIVRGYRVGRAYYALCLEREEATPVLWDPATSSLRTLLSARDVGERWFPWPLAVVADWVVFRAESGLLAWHPSKGITRLGPGMAVVGMGEAFLWWTAVPEDR